MSFQQTTFTNIKDPNFRESRKKQSKTKFVKGRRVDTEAQSQTYQIITMADKMTNIGHVEINVNNTTTLSSDVLETVGITLITNVEKYEDYSLIGEEDSVVSNPNIDTDLSKKKNKSSTATGKFPSSTDPFYTLDENLTRATELKRSTAALVLKNQNATKIAGDLAELNADKSTGTLKYFKK